MDLEAGRGLAGQGRPHNLLEQEPYTTDTGNRMPNAKKTPAKAAPKKKEINAEEQQMLDELRKEKEEFEARKQKAQEDEAERRKPFAANENKIQKALTNCEGHLRQLGDLELAREVLRRFTEQVKRGLP